MSKKKPRGKVRARKRQKEQARKRERTLRKRSALLKEIVKFNHEALTTECTPVNMDDNLSFIDKMKEILKISDDGIGLAANQINIIKRVILINPDGRGQPDVLINPEIIDKSDGTIGAYEGCLSYPGEKAFVERSDRVKVKYYDENKNTQEKTYKNLGARVVQHEIDHLNGSCYVGDVWREKQEHKPSYIK